MSVRKTIVGLQGSGKTQLAKKMIREKTTKKQKVLVVDILGEYNEKGLGNVDIYIPNNSINPISEVSELVNNYIITPFKEQKTQPYRLVVFDEASRYLNTKLSMPDEIGYINDFARHLNIDVITIARRFTQLNTDLVELSHNLYIFNQSGLNDIKRLNELAIGLGDSVLDLKPYHYIEVNQHRKYFLRNPIRL